MSNAKLQPHGQRPKQGQRPDFPRLLGGNLCLNFVNSVESPRHAPVEFLHSYADLIDWAEHVGMLTERQAELLHDAAEQSPDSAGAAFHAAINLRETLHRIFLAQAHQTAPDQADLSALAQAYSNALSHAQLTPSEQGYTWQWPASDGALDRLLWPVICAAVDLLCSHDIDRIKECPGADDCGWLFFDASKNGTRRWCSMEGCGSRVKMRRQYARKQGV